MKTVQVTIDEPLLSEVDEVVNELDTTRSAFLRQALQLAIRRHRIHKLEEEHKRGYADKPVQPDEFGPLMAAQAWGEE